MVAMALAGDKDHYLMVAMALAGDKDHYLMVAMALTGDKDHYLMVAMALTHSPLLELHSYLCVLASEHKPSEQMTLESQSLQFYRLSMSVLVHCLV